MSPMPRKELTEHILNGTRPEWVEPTANLAPGRPKYPRGISLDAKHTFKRLCFLLEKRRNLTEGDCELLRLYSLAYDRHSRAIAALAAEGEIVTYYRLDNHGEQVPSVSKNLWLPVAESCEKFMRGCLADLGLNPQTRSKVKQTEIPKPPEPDPIITREQACAGEVTDDPELPDETSIQ